MSTTETLSAGVVTASAQETRRLAARWAAELPPDTTVALHGDLGAGKTTWVQGMAEGLGISEPVTSPTFALYCIHRGPRRMLAHLDAYRLGSEREVEGLLLEEFLESPWILAVEWPERVAGWLADDALHLLLESGPGDTRRIRLLRRD